MSKTASGVCCIVKSCRASKRKVPNLRLFKFPKNDLLLKNWLTACGISDHALVATRKLVICHRHFDPNQLGEVYLKKNAVPQRHLDAIPSETQTGINSEQPSAQQNSDACESILNHRTAKTSTPANGNHRKSGRRCIIKSCRATYRNNPQLRFFSFPNSSTDRFTKWVKICKLTANDLKLKNILICEKHFWKAELCGKRYTAEAEPKFFLTEPRYKVIGPSDPKFIGNQNGESTADPSLMTSDNRIVAEEKSITDIRCIIKTCQIKSDNVARMTLFPKDALNLFDVWSDIFKLDPAEVFNIDIQSVKNGSNLYICDKHSLAEKMIVDGVEKDNVIDVEIKNETVDPNRCDDTEDNSVSFVEENKESESSSKIFSSDPIEESVFNRTDANAIDRLKKEAEKEKIKYLNIINQLKEENLKLKEKLSKFN